MKPPNKRKATKAKPALVAAATFTRDCDSQRAVYDLFQWSSRDAVIRDKDGKAIFEQSNMTFPTGWSDTAVKIVAQKYFKGPLGSDKREFSLQQLVSRVVGTIARWGVEGGYFNSTEAQVFANELTFLMVDQRAAFNSPVWFNVGTDYATNPDKPQCSACFINKVDDNMESILALQTKEGMIFKDGSGSGVNLSTLRSTKEMLSGGGRPSGPLSFMKGYDVFAGQIKSGGKTRRAAKMVILNVDHPDILEFIHCKTREEKKIPALVAAGYSTEFNAPNNAYEQVFYQNANNSVRVTDEFMRAAVNQAPYQTKAVTTGEALDTYNANDVLHQIAEAAWASGDPGMQFDDTINKWNPVLNKARINASNPCAEYVFIDDSSCNLASLNLMKFRTADGNFNDVKFAAAVDTMVLAQDILINRAGYPTREIEKNSHDYRPIGLGYANLGSLLMSIGIAYDSDQGRSIAAAITSFMTAQAYRMSGKIADAMGPFRWYQECKSSFKAVIQQHDAAAAKLANAMEGMAGVHHTYAELASMAHRSWWHVLECANGKGFRNAQVSLLAPTGTIGFMMDCATTGIEPELSLVKYKSLVGGGMLKLVNPTVRMALEFIYDSQPEGLSLDVALEHIEKNGHLAGAPGWEKHYPVFDTSFPPPGCDRFIDPMGHLRMMEATQPFLSGAISKTVNVPEQTSVEEIKQIYIEAWHRGLKSVAIYRNNCKQSQPLNLTDGKQAPEAAPVTGEAAGAGAAEDAQDPAVHHA